MGVLKYFKGSKNHYRFLILPGCEHSASHKCIKLKISKSELRLHMFGLKIFGQQKFARHNVWLTLQWPCSLINTYLTNIVFG